MFAENLENLVKKERTAGIQQGYQKAQAEAEQRISQAVMKMLSKGLSAEDVAEIFDLSVEEVTAIHKKHLQ